MEKQKNRRKRMGIMIALLFIVATQLNTFNVNPQWGYMIVNAVYSAVMFLTVYEIVNFLRDGFLIKEDGIFYLVLLITEIIAFLPLFTQKYLYGDDLWLFQKVFDGDITKGISMGRPFIKYILGTIPNLSFRNVNYLKIYVGFILLIYGCCFNKLLRSNKIGRMKALLFSVIAVSSCFMADCVAYGSIYPISMSLLLSVVSFIVYQRAVKDGKKIDFFISYVILTGAFYYYQIGTPIVFALYQICSKRDNCKKNDLKGWMQYLVLYGFSTITYLITSKTFQIINNIEAAQSSRAVISTSVYFYVRKLSWFFSEVIFQSLSRIVAVFSGNMLFKNNNMFYNCVFSNRSLEILVFALIIGVILFFMLWEARERNSKGYFIVELLVVFLTFWPFLVLPESTYLTYYAIALILLLLWYFVSGVEIIVRGVDCKLKNEDRRMVVCVIIFFIMIQSNIYSQKSWVNYCQGFYNYLADTIAGKLSNGGISTICVQGNLSPYVGGRQYVITCVKDILLELQYDPASFNILQRDSMNYVSMINLKEKNLMEKTLGEEVTKEILTHYVHDDIYKLWYYSGEELSDNDKLFLKNNFLKMGFLTEESKEVLLIDMSGFHERKSF